MSNLQTERFGEADKESTESELFILHHFCNFPSLPLPVPLLHLHFVPIFQSTSPPFCLEKEKNISKT